MVERNVTKERKKIIIIKGTVIYFFVGNLIFAAKNIYVIGFLCPFINKQGCMIKFRKTIWKTH